MIIYLNHISVRSEKKILSTIVIHYCVWYSFFRNGRQVDDYKSFPIKQQMVKQSFIQQDSCFTKYVLFASLLKFLNFYFKQMQDGNSLREALMFAQGISICMQYFVFSMYNIINSKYGIGSSNKYLLPMLPLPCNLDTNEEYGNMGHGVFKQGVQNQKDFCLRINIPRGND